MCWLISLQAVIDVKLISRLYDPYTALERGQDPEGCGSKKWPFRHTFCVELRKKVGGASILQPLLGMSTDSPRSVRGHNRESCRIMRERADHIVTARGSPHDRSVHGLGQRGRLANNDEVCGQNEEILEGYKFRTDRGCLKSGSCHGGHTGCTSACSISSSPS